MKPFIWITLLSLTANVLLGAWWLQDHPSVPPLPVPVPVVTQNETVVPEPFMETNVATSPVASVAASPAKVTSWKDLKTDDLKEFVRRLRAVHCPQTTVEDIICAEVNRIYAVKIRELWPDRLQIPPYWKSPPNDPETQKRYRESARKEEALQKEKTALLVDLLGLDPEKQHRIDKGQEASDVRRDGLAYIPEAKRTQVSKFLDDFQTKMQDFYARNSGQWDAQARTEQKQLEAERMQGLAQFLTPAELREYELHSSQLANQMKYELRYLPDLTRDQYEALYDIRKKYGDSIYSYSENDTQENGAKANANRDAMRTDISTALGADTGKAYQRSQDYSYQQLTRLATRNDLPPDTAAKIYDYKDVAEQSVREVQSNGKLTPEQRAKALEQIQAETIAAMESTVGPKVLKRYRNNGGSWLDNLNPTPIPANP